MKRGQVFLASRPEDGEYYLDRSRVSAFVAILPTGHGHLVDAHRSAAGQHIGRH
jgi:hypothetical protein